MGTFNRHGLSRNIPEEVKRIVRQRDGFGCVICANPIIDYEHVEPTFAHATKHDPNGITLLCPICHRKVTGRAISKALVQKAMRSPAAKKAGHIGHDIQFSDSHPTVIFGGAQLIRCKVPLHVMGEDVISIDFVDGRYLLNARFWDSSGNQTLTIEKNEWLATSKHIWDLKVVANKIIIQERKGKAAMTLRIEDNEKIFIENFEMLIKNKLMFKGNDSVLYVNRHKFQSFGASDCIYGMYFS